MDSITGRDRNGKDRATNWDRDEFAKWESEH
jgi:hypothetical protein